MEGKMLVQFYRGMEAKSAISQKREPNGEGVVLGQSMIETKGKYRTAFVILSTTGEIVEFPVEFVAQVEALAAAKEFEALQEKLANVVDTTELEKQIEILTRRYDEVVVSEGELATRLKAAEGDLADAKAELTVQTEANESHRATILELTKDLDKPSSKKPKQT